MGDCLITMDVEAGVFVWLLMEADIVITKMSLTVVRRCYFEIFGHTKSKN